MDKVLRSAAAVLPILVVLGLVFLGASMPWFFNNETYLTGFIFLQVLMVCLWSYERLFFPFLMIAVLWAGMEVPFSGPWNIGRWIVLGAGVIVGFSRAMRIGGQRYQPFHMAALVCVGSALVSAMVSVLPRFSLLKVISLALLFLYGASGARLVLRNPDRFFRGLLQVCEFGVYATTFCYLVLGMEIWGNGNSLGAVAGVVAAPILLWGALLAPTIRLRVRRAAACVGALYLVYFTVSRAAMLAAGFSMLALLIALRRYKLIVHGLVGVTCVLAMSAIAAPRHFDDMKASFVEGVVYKGHQNEGLLGSRISPWEKAMRNIGENPLFGTGFGTSTDGNKPFGEGGSFRSSTETNLEHGSSYLAITEWVGLMGILPFVALIVFAIQAVVRVFFYLRRTGDVSHYSVPLMLVVIAGLIHAGFEDWLFAVGYYLTVFFWVHAFLLMDVVPATSSQHSTFVHGMRLRYAPGPAATRP